MVEKFYVKNLERFQKNFFFFEFLEKKFFRSLTHLLKKVAFSLMLVKCCDFQGFSNKKFVLFKRIFDFQNFENIRLFHMYLLLFCNFRIFQNPTIVFTIFSMYRKYFQKCTIRSSENLSVVFQTIFKNLSFQTLRYHFCYGHSVQVPESMINHQHVYHSLW